MRAVEARRIQAYEETMKWPTAQAIGAAGVALVEVQLLEHRIVPCRPTLDIGFDLVTSFGAVMKRVQVKATRVKSTTKNNSTTFNIQRAKVGVMRGGQYMHTASMAYTDHEIDIFIFVHIESGHYYVIPADEIDLRRHKIALNPSSPWANAWEYLKTP